MGGGRFRGRGGNGVDRFPQPETLVVEGGWPFPLREPPRGSVPKPGVAPPRRYPGSMPKISKTPKGLCRGIIREGCWRVRGTARMDNVMTGFQYGIPPCAGQSSHSFLRHNHVVVVANLLHPPGVARKPAQPRALGHNACGVGEGEGENREWALGDVNGGTPLRSGVDRFPAPTDGMFPLRQRRTMR